jgi:hypothetical protein
LVIVRRQGQHGSCAGVAASLEATAAAWQKPGVNSGSSAAVAVAAAGQWLQRGGGGGDGGSMAAVASLAAHHLPKM